MAPFKKTVSPDGDFMPVPAFASPHTFIDAAGPVAQFHVDITMGTCHLQ